MIKEFKHLHISDVHLGHLSVPTNTIINNIKDTIKKIPIDIKDLDALFIDGDLLDRRLSLDSPEAKDILLFMDYLARLCMRNNIILRVLRGTWLHDFDQLKLFLNYQDDKLDLQYFDTIAVEHIKDFDLHILYVPDDMGTPEEVITEVRRVMKDAGVNKVDFASMHGAFTYQFPEMLNLPTHREDDYLALVRRTIHIGHVHQHIPNGQIIPTGSADRLGFGEPEDKGIVYVNSTLDGTDDWKFIVNANAVKFIDVDIIDLDAAKAFDIINKIATDIGVGNIRLIANRAHPFLSDVGELKIRHPTIRFERKYVGDKDVSSISLLDLEEEHSILLNKQTIESELRKHMELTGIDQDVIQDNLVMFKEIRQEHKL